MRRIVAKARIAMGSLLLLTFIASLGSADHHAKGIRAVLVYGSQLGAPIRVSDFEAATALYIYLARPINYRDTLTFPDLQRRSCLGIALFLPASRTAQVPVDSLQPQQGDLKYWFYPAVGKAAAVLIAFRAYPVYPEALADLTRHGVPVRLPPGKVINCDRPTEN